MLKTGKGIISELKKIVGKRKSVIITDENIQKLHLKKIAGLLPDSLVFVMPPGEESKSREMKNEIEDFLLENSIDRNSVIIALGGGVVSDISGFVASTYKRGISYINIPTTLLAMVDASIGGKTGINTKHGKNLIGSVWHPEAIICDIDMLKGLPKEELISGMAEVIKIAVMMDKKFFEFIEKSSTDNEKDLIYIIKKSAELKLKVVKQDERDNGIRNMLNFGHTIGHAVEICSKYKIKHGFCVSIGIAVECRLSMNIDLLSEKDYEKIVKLLKKTGLPVSIPKLDSRCLLEAVKNDKKMHNGKLNLVIIEKIGKAKLAEFDYELIKRVLE